MGEGLEEGEGVGDVWVFGATMTVAWLWCVPCLCTIMGTVPFVSVDHCGANMLWE